MFKNLCTAALGISGRPSEVIELALSNGFKGIDLDLADFAEQTKTHGVAYARRLLDSSKLKIGSFSLPINWQADNKEIAAEFEKLRPLADLAQQIGCARATLTIDAASDERPYHENFEFHRRRFIELAELLGGYQIRLGVGIVAPHALRQDRRFQFIQSVDALLMLVGTVSGNVGFVVDLWQWHLGGGTIEQIATLPAEKIVKVIVSDIEPHVTAEDATDEARTLPGETGVIDAAAVLKQLSAVGYDGPVTPKADKSRFAGLSRDKIAKKACTSLDELWKAAGLHPQSRMSAMQGR